jgi:hypothetical protein
LTEGGGTVRDRARAMGHSMALGVGGCTILLRQQYDILETDGRRLPLPGSHPITTRSPDPQTEAGGKQEDV